MTSPHTDPWPSTALNPICADIKPGDWLVLRNGWVVGPVIDTPYRHITTHVTDGRTEWQVRTSDCLAVPGAAARFVVFAGSLQHACTYRQQIDLADKTIAEIIAEEQAS